MFLRASKRFKDGKAHYYWSLVENVRVGRRVFQRQALYLGALNDSQRAEWQRTVEAFDENGKPQQMKLFPENRAPGTDDDSVVRIRTDRLVVKNLRKVLGGRLAKAEWQNVQDGISVKVARLDSEAGTSANGTVGENSGDTFVLTRSTARSLKVTSMRVKKLRGAMKTLFAVDDRIGRVRWRKAGPVKRELSRDELLKRLAVAEAKVGRAWKMISITLPKEGQKVTPETFHWHLDWDRIDEARANDEGTYLLRTNLPECDPKTLWKRYMIQGEIEYAFRELKNDLGLRPVYHQLDDRIEAHIFTAFMALCLFQTLRAIAREHAPGLTPRQIVEKFRTVKMVDVVMPTTDHRIVTLPRYIEPKKDVAILLDRLGLTLPEQPPPKVSTEAVETA